MEELANAAQEASGESVELAYVDQGYSGEEPAEAAKEHGIRLEVVKRPEAELDLVLLPRRWVVENNCLIDTTSNSSILAASNN